MASPFELNLRHLRAVAAIEASGSLSAAALAVSLSQPALTQGLARLEGQLCVALFKRRPDGMRTTSAGTIVAARGTEAIAALGRAMRPAARATGFAMPERLLTMAQVRAFLALADAGSFAGAAAATGIAPPSLHRATRDVERLAGAPLIERRGRGLVLTDRGRQAARGFRLAIGAIEAALAELASQTGTAAGSIKIGAMPLARARLLPDALSALCRAHPTARIVVVEGAHRELIDLLRDGRIDMMVGALREPAPGADIAQAPLCADRLAVIARAGHPLTTPDRIAPADLADLAAFPWIVGLPGAPVRALWERMFGMDGAPLPHAPIDCGSVMTIRGLLLSGDFLTLLSPDQVWVELAAGLLQVIERAAVPATRTIGISTRMGWRPTPEQRDMIALLHTAGERLSQNL